MRLTDEHGKPLTSVYLALSDEEASELIDALRELRSAGAGWHAHIADAALERELTVYREDDPTAR